MEQSLSLFYPLKIAVFINVWTETSWVKKLFGCSIHRNSIICLRLQIMGKSFALTWLWSQQDNSESPHVLYFILPFFNQLSVNTTSQLPLKVTFHSHAPAICSWTAFILRTGIVANMKPLAVRRIRHFRTPKGLGSNQVPKMLAKACFMVLFWKSSLKEVLWLCVCVCVCVFSIFTRKRRGDF